MGIDQHLTNDELSAYATRDLARNNLRHLGRHLLMCEACRKRLPGRTPERFMAAIITENTFEDEAKFEDILTAPSINKFPTPLAAFRNSLTFSTLAIALLLLVASISIVWLIVSRNNSSGSEEAANRSEVQNTERGTAIVKSEVNSTPGNIVNPVNREITTQNVNSAPPGENLNDNTGKPVTNPVNSGAKLPELKQDSRNGSQSLSKNTSRNVPGRTGDNTNRIVSATRGSLKECGSDSADLILSPSNETIIEKLPLLKWRAVPGAVKYHFYVSDAAKILIEDGEMEKGTTYQLKTPLELNKTYKWKVIATLGDNKTVSSESISFSVGETAQKYSPKKITRSDSNPIRCLQPDNKKFNFTPAKLPPEIPRQ